MFCKLIDSDPSRGRRCLCDLAGAGVDLTGAGADLAGAGVERGEDL